MKVWKESEIDKTCQPTTGLGPFGRSINAWSPWSGPIWAIWLKLIGDEMTRDLLSILLKKKKKKKKNQLKKINQVLISKSQYIYMEIIKTNKDSVVDTNMHSVRHLLNKLLYDMHHSLSCFIENLKGNVQKKNWTECCK